MDVRVRAAVSVLIAAALSAVVPFLAFADPGPVNVTIPVQPPTASLSVSTTSGTATVTTSTTSTTVTTTGATAGGNVPGTTATVGGSGTTAAQSAASVSTRPSSGTAGVGAALGTDPAVSVNDPMSQTSANAGGQANVVLCLLAQWSVQPSQAIVSSLCSGGSSTAAGDAQLGASNGIAGATLDSTAVVRAAACLLGQASSPAPGTITTNDALTASLSTLCGSGPSTASASGDTTITSSRTWTEVSAGPLVSAAACLLANGVVGTTTALDLATTCGSMLSRGPSTADAAAPVIARDDRTGTTADLAPAARAAACVLASALATVPDNAIDSSVAASVNASCATASGTTPSNGSTVAPVSADGSAASVDLTAAANAALCILANADLAASGSNASLKDACGMNAAGGQTAGTGGGAVGTSGTLGTGGDAAGSTGVTAAVPATGVNGIQIASLPSTSTATAGAVALLTILAAITVAMRRRSS